MTTREEIEQAALGLPTAEREKVLRALAESLDAEFVAEIRRREDAVLRGEPSIPADEVFAELLDE